MFLLTSSTSEIERHNNEADDFKQAVRYIINQYANVSFASFPGRSIVFFQAVAVDKQREFLEKSVEESERNLREMVSQKRSNDS